MAGSHTIGFSSEPRQVRKEATVLGIYAIWGAWPLLAFEIEGMD